MTLNWNLVFQTHLSFVLRRIRMNIKYLNLFIFIIIGAMEEPMELTSVTIKNNNNSL